MRTSPNRSLLLRAWGPAALLLLLIATAAAAQDDILVSTADPDMTEQGTYDLEVIVGGDNFPADPEVDFFVTGTTDPGGITVKKVKRQGPKNLKVTLDVAEDAQFQLKFDIEVRSRSNGRSGKGTELFAVVQKDTGKPPPDDPPAFFDPTFVHVAEKNFSRQDLWLMNADGSVQTLLLEGAKALGHTSPSWSPDGEWIVFVSNMFQGDGLYLIRPDGSDLHLLTPLSWAGWQRQRETSPVWSPFPVGGTEYVVYADYVFGDETWDLFMVETNPPHTVVNLTQTPDRSELSPSWAPDASRLAAYGFDAATDDVLVFDIDPSTLQITAERNVTAGTFLSGNIRDLSWAKGLGDERIAVASWSEGELWIITADGSSAPDEVLPDTGGLKAHSPSWSPDGAKIVFSGGSFGEGIYVIDSHGLFPPELLARRKGSTLGLYLPAWRP